MMTTIPSEFISKSREETIAFAKAFAKNLKPGQVLALEGGLGSGKTTFIKGIALGLGLQKQDEVKSPTFVVMHVYPTRVPLYHFDLYRMESPGELEAIGFEDFINDSQAISCVEWAEKAGDLLPETVYHIQLKVVDENSRKIRVRGKGI